MEELLLIILSFAFGWTAREWFAIQRMNRIMNQMQIHEEEQEMENMIQITIEHVDNKFFVYEQDGGVFMAQGNTRKELEENLMKRYPGKKFAAHSSNLQEVGFK